MADDTQTVDPTPVADGASPQLVAYFVSKYGATPDQVQQVDAMLAQKVPNWDSLSDGAKVSLVQPILDHPGMQQGTVQPASAPTGTPENPIQTNNPADMGPMTDADVDNLNAAQQPALPAATPAPNATVPTAAGVTGTAGQPNPVGGTPTGVAGATNVSPQDFMNQFSGQINQANTDLKNMQNQNATGRGVGQFLSALGGGPQALQTFNNNENTQFQHQQAITVGAVQAMQDSAMKGLQAANILQTMSQENQLFPLRKQALELTNELTNIQFKTSQMNFDSMKDLGTVGSPLSLATVAANQQAAIQAGHPELAKMITPQMSGLQAAAVVNAAAPGIKLSFDAIQAQATKLQAQAAMVSASSQAARNAAETRQLNLGTQILSNATNGGTSTPTGGNMSLSAGGVSITPSPATTNAQAGSANNAVQTQQQLATYDTTVKPELTSALQALKSTSTGTGWSALGKLSPTNQAQLAQKFAMINQAMPGMVPADIAARLPQPGQAGPNGGVNLDLSPVTAARTITTIMANAERMRAYTGAQQQYAQQHNGSVIGFAQSPQAAALNNSAAMFDPSDNQIMIVPRGSTAYGKIIGQGGQEAENYTLGK